MQPPDDDLDVREGDILHGDEIEVLDADGLDGDDIEVLEAEVLDGDDIEVIEEDAVPRVDPRIHARRIAVAREQGRRRLRVVLVLLSLVVVAGSAWLIVHSAFLDVDHIIVTGLPERRVAAVVAAAGVSRHDPLLLVSSGKVAHRVEQVPGIGEVHVSRDFPGTVRISVNQLGVAMWARVPAGGVALVGHDGRIIRYATTNPPGVVELRGVTRVPAPGGLLVRADIADLGAQLPAAMVARVGAVSAVKPSDIRLYLVAGGEVRVGDLSSLHDKAVAAEAVIERMGCPLIYVDVRSLSNPVALPAPGAVCNP